METKKTSDSKHKRQQEEKQPIIANEYFAINNIYKEMYEARQQRNKEKQNQEEKQKPEEKHKTEEKQKAEEIKKEEETKPLDSNLSIKVPAQILNSYLNSLNLKPYFYINKLHHYPKDQLKDNMISFREMLFEDLIKTRSIIPNEPLKRTLQAAFMTTFGFDSELLEPLIQAKVHLVVANDYDKNTKYEPVIENYNGIKGLTVIQPSKTFHGVFYSCFHPKLWLLKFPDFLRVVVSSGNLTTLDWSIWSNCLWYQDFYKKTMIIKETEKPKINEKNACFDYDKEFKTTLEDYLLNIFPKKIEIKTLLKIDLDDYVFENIDIILIPSLPGRHTGSKYGLSKIKTVLQTIEPHVYKNEEYVLTYQTSSLGTIDTNFLSDIAHGFLPNFTDNNNLYKDITTNIKVIYPTEKYVVKESYAGPEYAHPLLLMEKNFEKPSFIKKVFHRFEGTEDYNFHHGILPHLKVGIVTKKDMKIDDDTIIYYGSHNFTSSAWGKYEKNRSQILVSNTELGVLIPGKIGSKNLKEEIIKGLSFRFPATEYKKDDKPWIASKHFKNE